MSNSDDAKILLKITGLHKSFGAVEVLKGVSLEVKAGEVIAVMGPSGSGKSTMLRCINYLEQPSSGTIWLDGEYIGQHPGPNRELVPDSPSEIAYKRRQIGMLFQLFNLFAHLTALDNVVVGPHKVLGRSKDECRELALRLLTKVHLADHVHKYPIQMSGGQQQRVAIARALAMNPKVMLFDEPTSALDPRLTAEVLEVIRELADEGMTMLVITHELGFARHVADKVVYIEDGLIVEEGYPEQVFLRPKQDQTRRFLAHYVQV